MGKCVTRPNSFKLGYQKGPFEAPFGKKHTYFHHFISKIKNLSKAPFSEIDIGSYATATATDPTAANSPIMHSRLIRKDPKLQK